MEEVRGGFLPEKATKAKVPRWHVEDQRTGLCDWNRHSRGWVSGRGTRILF
jgi:hypothetical protein